MENENEGNKGMVGGMKMGTRGEGMKNKKMWVFAAVIAVILIAFAWLYAKGWIVAATVNGSPISRFAVVRALEKSSGKSVLDSLIMEKLVANEAKKKGIVVSEETIAQEMAKIEEQIAAQGGKLDDVLANQGLDRGDVKRQIIFQKQVEGLLGELPAPTEQEVDEYISSRGITLPKEGQEEARARILQQVKDEKLMTQGQLLVESLRTPAKINRMVSY